MQITNVTISYISNAQKSVVTRLGSQFVAGCRKNAPKRYKSKRSFHSRSMRDKIRIHAIELVEDMRGSHFSCNIT